MLKSETVLLQNILFVLKVFNFLAAWYTDLFLTEHRRKNSANNAVTASFRRTLIYAWASVYYFAHRRGGKTPF